MSDIEPVHQENTETQVIVNQEEFTIALRNYYSGLNENSKKLVWTNQRVQNVIKLLEDYHTIKSQGGRPTNQQYHHARKYDVMNIGNQKVLILKIKDFSQPVVQIVPLEEYYQKILETHIATGHGRRDKIAYALKDKYVVPLIAISIFLGMCKTCLSKKSFPKKGIVVKPLISEDFNRRGQMDLVDFQTSPDQDFKWLLQYQDHLTKFCFLRPLKSKQAKEVAIEMLKIFLEVGCPNILQSDNGREFTASVLKEIISLWPDCKIVNGRPRYPQSQGSIERSNQDVKNMIRAWMADNKSNNWSIGCYFVQFQKNSSYHSTIARTPYKALFGEDPKLGLSSTHLSKNIISKLETEKDVEKIYEDTNNSKNQNPERIQEVEGNENDAINILNDTLIINEKENNNKYHNSEDDQKDRRQSISNIDAQTIKEKEIPTSNPEVIILEEINVANSPDLEEIPTHVEVVHIAEVYQENISPNNNNIINKENIIKQKNVNTPEKIVIDNVVDEILPEKDYLICNVCNKESSGAHNCKKCNKIVHVTCGVPLGRNEGYGSQLLCNLCANEHKILEERTQSHLNLKRAADKMIATASKKFKEIKIGSPVLVEVPKVDRGPLDSKNLIGKVLDKKNELYQVGTEFGIIKDWMPRNAVLASPNVELNNIPEVILPLRTIASMSSSFGGQGMKQCNCKKIKKGQCETKRCNCKKANVLCNSRCHSSLPCKNK